MNSTNLIDTEAKGSSRSVNSSAGSSPRLPRKNIQVIEAPIERTKISLEPVEPKDKDIVKNEIHSLLIFPKAFELDNFTISLLSLQTCYIGNFRLKGRLFRRVKLRIESRCVEFLMTCVENSDILFSFELSRILSEFINTRIILIGTCGGSKGVHELGEAVTVKNSIKFDRGIIELDSGKIVMKVRTDKVAKASCSHPEMVMGVTTLCSNHLMNFDPCELSGFGKEFSGEIVDMDTFEFFKTCEALKVTTYDCIRVVSDLHDPKLMTAEETRLKRKIVSMDEAMWKLRRIMLKEMAETRVNKWEPLNLEELMSTSEWEGSLVPLLELKEMDTANWSINKEIKIVKDKFNIDIDGTKGRAYSSGSTINRANSNAGRERT